MKLQKISMLLLSTMLLCACTSKQIILENDVPSDLQREDPEMILHESKESEQIQIEESMNQTETKQEEINENCEKIVDKPGEIVDNSINDEENKSEPVVLSTPRLKEESPNEDFPVSTPNPTPTMVPVSTPVPTPESMPIPTPVPTPAPTPVSTPEPPKQACPGGHNPNLDCGVRIDKASPSKLFSVVDYGSADAAFAACDADGQSTTEFNGVEVRSYGCSQQTRNDYGIWGFAIYYMDINGNIID